MPNPVKKARSAEKYPLKSKGVDSNKKESRDLKLLLSLLKTSAQREEGAALSQNKVRPNEVKSHCTLLHNESRSRREVPAASEASELERFSTAYRDFRGFGTHHLHKLFSEILTTLVKTRLCSEWIVHAPPESALRVLICLRLLIREPLYQKLFIQLQGVHFLAMYMESVARDYLQSGEQPFSMERLVTMTYMFQKLSAVEDQRSCVIESGAHQTLVSLLSTRDSSVLLGALLALTSLAESPACQEQIGALSVVENLLVILQEFDSLSKRMAAELLRRLSPVARVREQVRGSEGLPVLLSLLQGRHVKLLWSAVWVLVQLCQEPDAAAEIRTWGGVQQLLRILGSEHAYVSDRSSIETLSSANASGRLQHVSEAPPPQAQLDSTMALQAACCAALTELALDDTTAHHVAQENGIYVVAKLILPNSSSCGAAAVSLQCYAFRTLRFLFSVERNRHLFKRLFPMDIFEMFIDVGHYVRDITAYEALQAKVSLCTEEDLEGLRESIEAVNQNRSPLRVISGYAVLDHLGTGAFGSVFKVRKPGGQNLLALKEVNLHNPAFGTDKRTRDSSVENIVSELTIIKEQMAHPNIVKYYKTFLEGERLFIVMELIEGVPLAHHFNSLKEKQQRFTEERVWNIFIQMCLALRYLHKEKRIVHRDLTPNNVMLGEKDKVTITDFGLAKQKQENSKLTSVVGSILYSCPEIVQSEAYGEKADVWALGCILYQMATLKPPFYSSNMLTLATQIVEAVFEPVEEGLFSERITDMIKWCLTAEAEVRPDIVAVSSRISDIMMRFMDGLYTTQHALERRAERDRKRAQKYFLERHRVGTDVCHSSPSLLQHHGKSTPPPSVQACSSDQGHPNPRREGEGSGDEDAQATPTSCSSTDCGPVKLGVCAALDPGSAGGDCSVPKPKPRPVSAGICVSQKRVRQIDDPIQRLLVQLHKIVFITQLPPALNHNDKRRAIERFKKSLFQYGTSPYHLKVELNKLLQASPELLELSSTSPAWWALAPPRKPLLQDSPGEAGDGSLREGVTYAQMQAIIEEVLEDSGYYSCTSSKGDDPGASGVHQSCGAARNKDTHHLLS